MEEFFIMADGEIPDILDIFNWIRVKNTDFAFFSSFYYRKYD